MDDSESNKKFDALFRKLDELVSKNTETLTMVARHDERINGLRDDHNSMAKRLWAVIAAIGTALVSWAMDLLHRSS